MQNPDIVVPTDRQNWEGEIATYWFDEDILVSLSKSTRRTIESISRNVALVKEITNNKPAPLLIYLADSPVPDKATRKFSTEQLPVIYKAMAMVSKPGLSTLIMSILFRFTTNPNKKFYKLWRGKELVEPICVVKDHMIFPNLLPSPVPNS